jgi:hypothetical protein
METFMLVFFDTFALAAIVVILICVKPDVIVVGALLSRKMAKRLLALNQGRAVRGGAPAP